ncbi:DUF2281 domain-containing protein [Desertifilum sp. FACHB-1129]|uniref:DUF2281 domain-containing protein n=2 Tax=Desertifilum tharense IPPAS B-1220 TaxID=1781255 RepID=A0A1E5QDM4_9CYAN|nr:MULTISPECIES: hypothetical protein [Desertifilum]MDA0213656.1 DUF2281 domain-containing protein [Cyanobacteria bacterium FC1]MBD2312870.1 DUF2281 domain-containing protein [Desertifilum sp. FACHB-1129]MBD2325243.1 DUF2281 domain-containing protein [Desertifilum sp. FACHB-866]MBD2335351.1 DUF2281 domain-containing protein [Desertifilum sp. FACHB-868]OEJ72762.1 hypothetical protein BH720_23340 [Desertifilum tharense IPPAS B-1220]
MSIAEQVYELVKSLPQDQASEILAFAQQIRDRSRSAESPDPTVASASWSALVYSLAGSWGDDFPSLEEIRSPSGQDILRESL